jgi:putative PIN family toxin of toxin-antitoxin system
VKVVVDTTVLVSGLLAPSGPCGEIVRLIVDGAITACHSPRIITEYREVLHRPRFRFNHSRVDTILAQIQQSGVLTGPLAACPALPDPDDQPFLEAALSGNAACIVTGNTVHFPARACRPVPVVNPAGFLKMLAA